MMTKTPPNRRGITFEVGAQLEARDSLKNWYQASIEKIDYEEEKVLIHYRQWSHRYDEWFDWTSPYLRPLERIQLRREGLQDKRPSPVFRVNEKVLACWVDCRYYPAKVLEVKRDASYTVKFFDGVVKTLKPTKVKPYKKENGKARERDRTQSEQSGGKDKAKENGKAVSDESKNDSSDLDGERNGEEEERREDGEEKTLNGNVETSGQKGNLNGEEGEKGAGGGQREEPQAKENGQVVQTKREEVNVEGERVMRSTQQQGEKKEEGASGQSPQLPRGNRYRPSEESQRELRKRRVSLGQMPPPKRRRPDTSKDRNSQSQKQAGSDSVPESPALTPDQTNTQTPTDAGIEAPSDIGQGDGDEYDKSILKCQVHLPTTHKYSREPLYRVIKNQPPPILSIELDHNPFKCKAPGCLKSFRKVSLLHYHVKYYHADSEHASGGSMQTRASEKQAGFQETPRKRRTMSGSIHSPLGDRQAANGMNGHRRRSLSEKRKENQHTNSRPHEEREWGASETGEKIREKTERDFLNKQKKRKKKGRSKSENTNGEENIGISLFNSTQSNPNLVSKFPLSHKHKLSYDSSPEHITDQVQEDDESDWSTVSAEWSDEYMEAEMDVTTPMSEQNVSMVTKGSDIVRCVCEVEEENDFMIQCDECLCWQHGTCMGLFEHNVPDTYNCYICRDPPVQRQSQHYWYDRDWLSSGHMYGLSFLDENYSHQNGKKITATHQLLGDVHHVFEVLNGLQLKMSILQTQTHSDLKLWRQPWKQEEELGRSCSMATCRAPSPAANDRGEGGDVLRATSVSAPSEKLKRVQMSPTSFQDSNASYISSEHCYQKPRAYYPAVEQRLVVETRGGSELEDSLRSTENLLEQCYGGPLDPDRAKLYPSSLLQDRAKIHPIALQPDKGLDLYKKLYVGMESEVEMRTEEAEPSTDIKPDPEKDNVLHQQWQINLLDHIEAMQNQVTHRMDLIEKELDVLESWLDYTGELEPPDPLTRLPQLKHRIRQMLTDLGTVQQISLCSSKT